MGYVKPELQDFAVEWLHVYSLVRICDLLSAAARDGVEDWEHTEMRELRDNSPVMEQLWTDAIVELESDMGRDWKDLMHHHSLSDPSYRPRS